MCTEIVADSGISLSKIIKNRKEILKQAENYATNDRKCFKPVTKKTSRTVLELVTVVRGTDVSISGPVTKHKTL